VYSVVQNNMKKNRKILFSKWVDPFLQNLSEFDEEEAKEIQGRTDLIEEFTNHPSKRDLGQCIIGPMGIIPINEYNTPSANFNFWIGHANFGITHNIAEKMQMVPGVERLEIFTRYRFRVGIGRAFKEKKVLRAIKAVTGCQIKPARKGYDLEAIIADLKQFKNWAIYIDNKGELDIVRNNDNLEELQEDYKNRKGYKKVYASWIT
jgi:hypothetical protein